MASETPWQPIATASKDAKRIELWIPEDGYNGPYAVFGHWENQRFNKRPNPYWTNDLERTFGIQWVRQRQPTHWRPMSAGPTQETGEQHAPTCSVVTSQSCSCDCGEDDRVAAQNR